MYYALTYITIPDYAEKKLPFRKLHLKHVMEAKKKGQLLIGGPFTAPDKNALLIFKAENKTIVEDFAKNDPYIINGLVSTWEVNTWTIVVGEELL